MFCSSIRSRRTIMAAFGLTMTAGLVFPVAVGSATAAITPILLGTAGSYSVLAGTEVTNTGPSVLNGNLGVYPSSTVTGFGGPPTEGMVVAPATIYAGTTEAQVAQSDLTVAFDTVFSQSPVASVPADLVGQVLTAGVYGTGDGSTLGSTGALTLNGDADDVFVFLAQSDLIMGTGSSVVLTGGAQACNVFWGVASSATLNTGAAFVGTVLALTSITVENGATIEGRLLARNGNVTLDNNVITAPGCAALVDEGEGGATDESEPGLAATGVDGLIGTIAGLAAGTLVLLGVLLYSRRRARVTIR